MIKEFKGPIVKCHNCGRWWEYGLEDVDTYEYQYQHTREVVKRSVIKCPKCGNTLDVFINEE